MTRQPNKLDLDALRAIWDEEMSSRKEPDAGKRLLAAFEALRLASSTQDQPSTATVLLD